MDLLTSVKFASNKIIKGASLEPDNVLAGVQKHLLVRLEGLSGIEWY